MSETVICANCKHFVPAPVARGLSHQFGPTCNYHRDIVYGSRVFCSAARVDERLCGYQGRCFEQIDPATVIADLKADLESEIKRPWWKFW